MSEFLNVSYAASLDAEVLHLHSKTRARGKACTVSDKVCADLDYFHNPAGVLQGGINASLAGGSVVGAIFAGWVSNKLGRKWAIFIACLWWLVGTLLQVTTKTVGQLIVGRLLNGICVGLTSSQVPVYLAEIAKKEKRGSIICIQQVLLSNAAGA